MRYFKRLLKEMGFSLAVIKGLVMEVGSGTLGPELLPEKCGVNFG